MAKDLPLMIFKDRNSLVPVINTDSTGISSDIVKETYSSFCVYFIVFPDVLLFLFFCQSSSYSE